MAHILTHSCAAHPYGLKSDEVVRHHHDLEPLVKWDASQWQGLRESFYLLRNLMLRKDAVINYLQEDDVLPDGGEVDGERRNSSLFKKSFRLLMDQIAIHRILSPIRNALEVQTRKTGKESIGKKKLKEVWADIRSLDDKSIVKEALLDLFDLTEESDEGEEEGEKRSTKKNSDLPKLKSLSELAMILQFPPFDLCRFQNRVEHLLHQFNQIVSGGEDCALIRARYTIPIGSALYQTLEPSLSARVAILSARRRKDNQEIDKASLEDLRRGRAALKSIGRHGNDPLDAAVRIAKKAGKVPAAEDSEFDDDEEEESREQVASRRHHESRKSPRKRRAKLTIVEQIEEDEEEGVATLSQVPKRLRPNAPLIGGQHSIPPDEGIFDENGKVVKRLKWTDEEKLSVKEGVRKFGIGKWKDIKAEYNAILRNRSAVQIKDCWRTMAKNNEV